MLLRIFLAWADDSHAVQERVSEEEVALGVQVLHCEHFLHKYGLGATVLAGEGLRPGGVHNDAPLISRAGSVLAFNHRDKTSKESLNTGSKGPPTIQ